MLVQILLALRRYVRVKSNRAASSRSCSCSRSFCSTNKMDILRKKVCSFILTFNYSSYLFDDLKNKFKRFSH